MYLSSISLIRCGYQHATINASKIIQLGTEKASPIQFLFPIGRLSHTFHP